MLNYAHIFGQIENVFTTAPNETSLVLFVFGHLILFMVHQKPNFNKQNRKAMKAILLFCTFVCSSFYSFSQAKTTIHQRDKTKPVLLAELACGQCQFKMPGKSCDLAVRINGQSYFVDGVHIDSLGNAHASDGMCNAITKAEVQGELDNDRYKVTYVKLLKPKKKKQK